METEKKGENHVEAAVAVTTQNQIITEITNNMRIPNRDTAPFIYDIGTRAI